MLCDALSYSVMPCDVSQEKNVLKVVPEKLCWEKSCQKSRAKKIVTSKLESAVKET